METGGDSSKDSTGNKSVAKAFLVPPRNKRRAKIRIKTDETDKRVETWPTAIIDAIQNEFP